jgi:hypothetical protein
MRWRIPKQSKHVVTYYKVYFDKKTGQIQSITTDEKPHLDTYFSTTFNEVEKFIEGTKNLIDHKVVYDLKKSNYLIVHKNDKIVLDVSNLIHQIQDGNNAQLLVTKNNKEKCWQLSIDSNLTRQNNIHATILDETLWFSVTQKNNPNVLYRHFVIGLKDLTDKETIDIDFDSQEELDLEKYSVYTNRRLVSYAKREIND